MKDKKEVVKKVCLVTGSSSGLGKEIAKLCCQKGLMVYVTARREEELLNLKHECENNGSSGEIHVVAGDLTHAKFRKNLIEFIIKKQGKIDYLINNAGYGKLNAHEDIHLKDIEGMFNLNCIALQDMCRLVLPIMKKQQKARIINIASVAAIEPPSYFATYNSTKYAVHGFTKSLSYELADSNVSVSAVFPPRMNTSFWTIAFKCKNLGGSEQKTCADEWAKKSTGSLSVAKYVVNHLDSKRLILLPGVLPKLAYGFLRHFKFIGSFFMKNFQVKKAKEMLNSE
jgi:uncharacterized protein